jgi:hypothetical protein
VPFVSKAFPHTIRAEFQPDVPTGRRCVTAEMVEVSHTQSPKQEIDMSALNGDKSRYHRERKQKIARRTRTRELLKHTDPRPKSAGLTGDRTGPVSA